jgi:glycosyltransferase involved in cell wall biosynthesis
MKIAEVCLNSSLGGLELYYFWCCRYFKNTTHELTAITVPKSRLEVLLKDEGIQPTLIDKAGFLGGLRAAYKLARVFEQKKIDVVHVHFAKDLPIVALAKSLSRQPVRLVHSRQMEMPAHKKDPYHRWVYSQVDRLLCVTEKLTQEVRDRVPLVREKISRLYYGVPKPSVNLVEQKAFLEKFPSNKFKVAMFSRLEDSKGQWRLLEALHLLKNQGLDFQIYFFGHFMGGDGYEEKLKALIAKYALTDSVYWCGFQKNPGELMPCFDLILLPSDQETFGLVLIEAMAAGVAIMGSNTGGVPEIIEDGVNGFTFVPNDIKDLSEKIKTILTDKQLREKFINAGWLKYEKLFRADQHFSRLEEILKNS